MRLKASLQPKTDKNDQVRTLARGLDILELLKDHGALTLTEIANQLGMNKSTIHRLISTLCDHGLVEREPDSQKYYLSLHMLTYGHQVIGKLQLRRVALPHLEYLQQISGQRVLLSTLHQGMDLWLEILRPPSRIYHLA